MLQRMEYETKLENNLKGIDELVNTADEEYEEEIPQTKKE